MRALSFVLGACVVAGCAPADGPDADDLNADGLDGFTVTGNIPDSVDIDQVLADLPAGGFAPVGDGASADVAIIQAAGDPLDRVASSEFTASAPSCPDCGTACSAGSTREIDVTLTHNSGSPTESLGIATVSASNFSSPSSTPSHWTQAIGTQQLIKTTGTLATCTAFTYTFDVTALDQLRVFVSSAQTTGAFGSAASADSLCQGYANAKSLGGTWKAWVSDASSTAASRFSNPGGVNYVLLNGTTVANGLTDLEDGSLDAGITTDENGTSLASNTPYWTGTKANGGLVTGTAPTVTCKNWTLSSASPNKGVVGLSGKTNNAWTYGNSPACSTNAHLACFEQDL